MARAKFWMVLGCATPIHRHRTEGSALQEAERLARQNPEQEFVVLEAVAVCKKTDVVWEPLVTDDDNSIPF